MQTQQPRAVQRYDISMLTANFLTTDKIHLFTSPTAPVDPLPISGFTEATFTGYTAVALTNSFSDGIDSSGNGITKNFGPNIFSVTAAGPAEIQYGWYITDSLHLTLKAYAFFDVPLSMANVGDSIAINPFVYALFEANGDVEFIAGS